jgi:hypothetical protein
VFVLEVSTETDLLPILLARLFDLDVEESDNDLGHLGHYECETREEEGSKI